jgi:hypothetical protein
MCQKRNTKRIILSKIRVDACMKNLIELMRASGIRTLACCCGHGRYPMSIVIERYGIIFEVMSKTEIPRRKKFYKMDSEGYYYIPEVVEEKNEKIVD